MIERKSYKDLGILFKMSQRGTMQNAHLLGRNFADYIEYAGRKIVEEVKDPIGTKEHYHFFIFY